MSLGNPTPVAGSNAANAAGAATAPSSAGGSAGTNPFGSGLDGLTDALGSGGVQTQNIFAQQPQWNNTPTPQPTNNITATGGVQAPPLNVAPPPPVAQPAAGNNMMPVATPVSTVAQAPASVTAGSTINSMMQPVTPAMQQPAPVDPTSFVGQVPQNQTVAPTSTDPTSFLGSGAVNGMVPQNVASLLSNPAGF